MVLWVVPSPEGRGGAAGGGGGVVGGGSESLCIESFMYNYACNYMYL